MPYALSFAEEFFIHDDVDRIQPSERAVSVYQAILGLQEDTLHEIAHEVFGLATDRLTPEIILAQVIETNTCSDLDEPVEVWIDPEGDYSLDISSPAAPLPVTGQLPSS